MKCLSDPVLAKSTLTPEMVRFQNSVKACMDEAGEIEAEFRVSPPRRSIS